MNTAMALRCVFGLMSLLASNVFAQTGTVKYITDAVFLEGELVHISDDSPTVAAAGQRLRTEIGHAEIYIATDSLLRLGMESEVEIVVIDAGSSTVRLIRGAIIVDAIKVKKSSPVVVLLNDTSTTITTKGTYRFDAAEEANSSLQVRRGKAVIADGSGDHLLKKGHAAAISTQGVSVHRFDEFPADELTAWHDERSRVIAEEVFLDRHDTLDLSGLPAESVVFGDRGGPRR